MSVVEAPLGAGLDVGPEVEAMSRLELLAAQHQMGMDRIEAHPEEGGFLTHPSYREFRLNLAIDEDGVRVFDLSRSVDQKGIIAALGAKELNVGSEEGPGPSVSPEKATGLIATLSAFVTQGSVEINNT